MSQFRNVSRRQLLQQVAFGTFLIAAVPGYAVGRTGDGQGRWPAITPPRVARIPHTVASLGRTRDDPYAWMKFIPVSGERSEARLPQAVGAHLAAENEYARAMLAPLRDEQAAMLEKMLVRSSSGASAPAMKLDGWRYSASVPAGGVHKIYTRRKAGGKPQTLVNEEERATGTAYFRATDHQFSPDHRYFAWAEDVIGNDRHRIVLRDSKSGKIRTLVEKDAYGYGGVAFAPSSRWLFWIWRDARNRPTRLYRTSVDGGPAELVYEETDPAIFMGVKRTAADGFVALTLSGPETSEVRLIPAEDETGIPAVVQPRRAGTRYEIDEWNGDLVSLTDADGAFDLKLMRLDRKDFTPLGIVVPHRAGVPILAMMPFGKALVRLERLEGLHRLVIRGSDGTERTVAFDDAAYTIELPPGQSYHSDSVRIVHQSPKSPRRWIDVGLKDGKLSTIAREQVSGFIADHYDVERLLAPASDGEMVPITVLSRRGALKDGSSPLLLYGYGSYGVSSDPEFSVPATVLVDRGWRYAIAHVRGGSEKGRRWFLEGRKFSKRNSFTDFIACAEHLGREGYAAKDKIVSYGLSAGGLLVGASMNISPTLWAGVIAKVPFVDMLNTMSDADHPLVPLFRPDWGDPLADPKAYDYVASISPYENVRAARYPPLLCTAGLKDDRVAYWEPAKLVAEVRHRSTSDNPALLLTDMNAGHQGSGDMRSEYGEMALFWAFADRCVTADKKAI